MARFGFHASHEQLGPADLLGAVQAAEAAGFSAAMCSDHLAPWSRRQGHSGHAWSWLGAALQASSFTIGVVTSPGHRYHPAVAAQSYATLADMFPGRFWVALGSGEALNEHVTGRPWPDKPTRDALLLEVVAVIKSLLAGDEVTHHGLVEVDRARVWSLPEHRPPLLAAAISEETALRAAGWADGLITVNQPVDALRRVVDRFRAGGGESKPIYMQVHLSWADDEDEAQAIAHDQWKTNVFGSGLSTELATPDQFETAAQYVALGDVEGPVLISSDLHRHTEWLAELAGLGFDRIYLHHVGQDQQRFIDVFGAKVIPELTS